MVAADEESAERSMDPVDSEEQRARKKKKKKKQNKSVNQFLGNFKLYVTILGIQSTIYRP